MTISLADTTGIKVTTAQRAVIYDCDAERAAEVAEVLRALALEPMSLDHAALVTTVMQSPGPRQVLLIGDVSDGPDWTDLGAALRNQFGDVPVIAYGSKVIADRVSGAVGAARVIRVPFPFTQAALVSALHVPAAASLQEAGDIRMPTGTSRAIREVVRLIRQVAAHDSSVLILGESGTGKEVAARAIHDASPRRQRPFVAVNCGAIPAELLESELFGHEKGSFTGAVAARKGRFEIAEGGTLFLDEIGDMSMPMQVKLLRVLQERTFERVGNHTPMRCNVRIIAATHRNLEDSITRGTFREDLFYRLNVFPIEMPSLRSRIEDMPLLARDFSEQSVAKGRARVQLSARTMQALSQHPWPGNVRELGNLIERLSILCPDRVVEVGDLPAKYRPADWTPEAEELISSLMPGRSETSAYVESVADLIAREDSIVLPEEQALLTAPAETAIEDLAHLPAQGLDLRTHLYEIERTLIRQALERAGGTVAHAARLLQLRRTTLVEKLRKFEMLSEEAAATEA